MKRSGMPSFWQMANTMPPEALVGRLYPELSAALVPVAARQVLAHLIHLDEQGAAVSTPGGWRAV